MRFLFVVWDGGGNAEPQLAIAGRLVERGHDVRVLGHRSLESRAERRGAAFSPFVRMPDADSRDPETDPVRDWEPRTPAGAAARVRDRLILGPALALAEDVRDELGRRGADVVAADFLLLGALAGAESLGVRTAALGHTVYYAAVPGAPPFGYGLRPATGRLGRARDAVLTRAGERFLAPGVAALDAARARLGLDPVGGIAGQLARADRVLVLTSAAFDFAARFALPPNVMHVGPVVEGERPAPASAREPLVAVSLSTSYMGQRALAGRVLAALAELPVRGVLTTGPALDVAGLPIPGNVEVRDFVPHGELFGRCRLVVTHAGLGTVTAALMSGTPLLCLPGGRDQYDTAARVVAAGAGARLPPWAPPAWLRRAMVRALADGRLREGAERMGRALREEDGLVAAVAALEGLAGEL